MDNEDSVSRRTFMKGIGVAAGATGIGLGASGAAAAHEGFHTRFANPRVREAAKVWEPKPWREGYRGRPDRTMVVNDSGMDLRHPDLGPWNGVTAVGQDTVDGNGRPEVQLTTPAALDSRAETRSQVGEERSQTEVLGPGTTVEGSETAFPPFTVPDGEGIVDMDAELSWTPENVELPATVVVSEVGEDQSFRAELNVGTPEEPEWVTLQTVDTGGNPETLSNVTVVPGAQHRFVAGQFANVVSESTVTFSFHTYEEDLETVDAAEVFDFSGFDATPKTVGWFDAGARYGTNTAPADPDGHGSHVSGIMAGSGRASTVDPGEYVEDAPRTVLTAGQVVSYEVTADAGTGVFGVATGEGIEVVIEGPTGRTLRTSSNVPPLEEARVEHPTVDARHPGSPGERGPATYTVHVRPLEGEAVSTGRVEEVAVGAFVEPHSSEGDRVDGDASMHSGLAPDAGLVGLQGLSGPVATMGLYGEELVEAFNVRTMNSSWGGLVPGGGTVGGSSIERAIKRIGEAGVLLVAAAGNTFGSPTGAPGIADEAVAVTATDDLDGVTTYTDGGAQAQDEDDEGTYGKPDVCAPGGTLVSGHRSVRARAEEDEEDPNTQAVDGTRDYVSLPGTSMASPYACGTAGLLAEAMEFGAPDAIALPEPAETGLEDVLRLKSVLLGTASTTAFTAAPYHKHPVRYVHDGRDTYVGYGRVNPDAAVDAVTRDLLADATVDGETLTGGIEGSVGLAVPDHSRAVAGYVEVPAGTLEAAVGFTHYAGGNSGMTKDVPWLDLFVYDAETPARAGEPNTLASAMGQGGEAAVTVDVEAPRDRPDTPEDEAGTRTLFVVVKLVNVPGVVNGYDVEANFELDLSFTGDGPLPLPAYSVDGTRSDDGSVFTQGETNRVDVTVESMAEGVEAVAVDDFVPEGWTVQPFGDAAVEEPTEGGRRFDLGTVARSDLGTDAATRTYFVEATGGTGRYTFGPAEAELLEATREFSNSDESVEVAGTDTNSVVGVDQTDAPL